jgi:hypothetical protein
VEQADMPVARYFIFVGGLLLALLFGLDAVLPKLPVADQTEAAADLPVIRINSDRKWPERVVFDTSVPAVIPAQPVKTETAKTEPAKTEAAIPATTVADVPATARVRDAFAQLQPADLKKPEPKLQPQPQPKRKVAKNRPAPPMVLVAQQPRFGFFANNTW